MSYKKHIFICQKCQFQTESGMSDPALAESLRKEVKDKAAKIWPKQDVRINASGCLGRCEEGIACVIYPEQKWLTELRPDDGDKIIKEISQLLNKS